MATTSIADKLAKLEKKIAKREKTIAEEQAQLDKETEIRNNLNSDFPDLLLASSCRFFSSRTASKPLLNIPILLIPPILNYSI